MSFIIYGPVILMRLFGLTPFTAGLVVMSETLAWGFAAIVFSGFSDRAEPWLIRCGSALVLVGLCLQALVLPDSPLWLVVIVVILGNLGFGMMWGYIIKRLTAAAVGTEKDRAASLPPITQQTGFALGAAFGGLIANSLGLDTSMEIESMRTVTFWLFAGFIPLALVGNVFAWRFVGDAKPEAR